ncbi:MAG: 4'-phosphopantetheinyl transferase family protein [Hypericibacter sp.]
MTLGSASADALIAQWITQEDRAQFSKYRRPEARAASLLARAALKALLAHQTAEKSWVFSHDSTGKLRVTAPGMAGMEGSISHSGTRVACAVSRVGPIGIDIEAHRPRAYDAIARYGFGSGEQAQVTRLGARAFYRIWTLREAMGKATGEGLALATDGVDRVDPSPEKGCWVSQPAQGPAWRLAHEFLEPDYSLALALPGRAPDWRPDAIVRVDLPG